MKVIKITSSEDFDLLYQGFIIGGNSQERKTMQETRREVKILDKFESISEPRIVGGEPAKYPTGDAARDLVAPPEFTEAVELALTDEEHALLKKYFEAVSWTTQASRRVVRLADLIDSAEERSELKAVK